VIGTPTFPVAVFSETSRPRSVFRTAMCVGPVLSNARLSPDLDSACARGMTGRLPTARHSSTNSDTSFPPMVRSRAPETHDRSPRSLAPGSPRLGGVTPRIPLVQLICFRMAKTVHFDGFKRTTPIRTNANDARPGRQLARFDGPLRSDALKCMRGFGIQYGGRCRNAIRRRPDSDALKCNRALVS
jgi:hypothetical protein